MNKKQKIVLSIFMLIFAPPLVGTFIAAVQFNWWDNFFKQSSGVLCLMIIMAPFAAGLIYILRDKKSKS